MGFWMTDAAEKPDLYPAAREFFLAAGIDPEAVWPFPLIAVMTDFLEPALEWMLEEGRSPTFEPPGWEDAWPND